MRRAVRIKSRLASTLAVPGQATTLSASPASASTVTLTWVAPVGGGALVDYVVQFSAAGANAWATFSDGVSTTASTTVTGLTPSTAYDFRVAASNSSGLGAYSPTATASTTAGAVIPTQVLSLVATAVNNVSVALTWALPSNTPTDYIVEYKVTASGTWLIFTDGVSAALSTTVTGLSASTAYDFRVSATNAAGTGPVSSTASATTTSGTVTVPTFIVAPSIDGGYATVGVPVTYTPGVVTGGGTITRVVLWLWDDQPISGAPTTAGSTYTPTAGQVGLELLRVKETATNSAGSWSRNSEVVDVYVVGPANVPITIQKPTDATNLATYRVYRSTINGGPYTDFRGSVTYSGAEEQVFTDNSVTAGLYYYVVCGVDASGNEGDFGPQLRKGVA